MAYQDKNSRWRTGSEVKLLPITSVRFYFDIYTLSGSLISRWDQTCELQDIFWSCSTWRQKVHLNQSTDSLHQVFTLVTALWSGRCTWMEKTNCIEVQPDRSQSESMFKQSYTQHVIFDLSVLRLYTVFVLQYTYCILLWKKNSSMIVFLCFFFPADPQKRLLLPPHWQCYERKSILSRRLKLKMFGLSVLTAIRRGHFCSIIKYLTKLNIYVYTDGSKH